jgi:capsular exopolysaccharide synthesis family protein
MSREITPVGEEGSRRFPDAKRHSVEEEVTLGDLLRVVYLRRWLIAGTAAVCVVLALIFSALQSPQYDSQASLRVYQDRTSATRLSPELSALTGLAGVGRLGSGIETERWVLQSRRIIAPVVDSLALHVQLKRPVVPRSQIFSELLVISEPVPGDITLRRRANGAYSVDFEPTDPASPPVSIPAEMVPGVAANIGGVILTLNQSVSDRRIQVRVTSSQRALEFVHARLSVEQLGRGSDILSVRFRGPDRELAAAVPNTISDAFLRYRLTASRSDAQRRAEFLRQQVARYDAELAAAEEDVRAFREREQIISVEGQATEQVRRMAQLQVRHDELVEEWNALNGLLQRLESAGDDDSSERYRSLAAFPVFFNNRTIQVMLESLIELENRRAELTVLRTARSIDVQAIDGRIAELEQQLFTTVENYRTSLDSQLASITGTLNEFMSRLGTVPAVEVEFARFVRRQRLLTDIHSQLTLTLRETEVEEAIEPAQIELLDPAVQPLRASAPRPALNLLVGGVLGLILGLGFAFAREAVDHRVYSKRDVAVASGGIAVLGAIPHLNGMPGTTRRRRLALPELRRTSGSGSAARALVTRDAPRTPGAEAFRGLRTQLTSRTSADHSPALVVSSAAEGEGKSITAANLAVAFAQQGARTILCDCDLRKGKLHEMLGLAPEPGVSDVLLGRAELEGAVQQAMIGGASLDVLTAGTGTTTPAELFGGARMVLVLQELARRYDRIIIDTPPLGTVTDAAVLGTLPSSTMILITRAGRTDRRALEEIASELRSLGANVLGVIINDLKDTGPLYSASS